MKRMFTILRASFAKSRGNSQWIYSSKSQEMMHANIGRVFIVSDVGNDLHDCTLRMHNALQNCHLVLSYHTLSTKKFLEGLSKKQRYSQESLKQQQGIIKADSEGQLVTYSKQQLKQQSLQSSLEMSKQLQLALETQLINRSNNDRQNRFLKQSQDQLLRFMERANLRQELQKFKQKNGYPKIISLDQNFHRIQQMREAKADVVCVVSEKDIDCSKQLFSFLEQQKIPYQVLPASNELINMLAASGFPADRFAIQYFPVHIEATLLKRRPMKMTVAIMIHTKKLRQAIDVICNTYGKQHFVYIQGQQGMLYRGEIQQAKISLKINQIQGQFIRIAVSPYLSLFNQDLKEEKNKVSRLYGQAMDDKTHFVRMEFISQQLEQLLKRKDQREVMVDSLIQQLLARIENETTVAQIAQEVLGVTFSQAQSLIDRAKKGLVVDHLGLMQEYKSR